MKVVILLAIQITTDNLTRPEYIIADSCNKGDYYS